MRALRAWFRRLGGIFGKQRRERELAEELDGHLQMHIVDGVRAGLSQDEARFPMVPTATATLGVKGHRPLVGTWVSRQASLYSQDVELQLALTAARTFRLTLSPCFSLEVLNVTFAVR